MTMHCIYTDNAYYLKTVSVCFIIVRNWILLLMGTLTPLRRFVFRMNNHGLPYLRYMNNAIKNIFIVYLSAAPQ